jgi:hypothetical protein
MIVVNMYWFVACAHFRHALQIRLAEGIERHRIGRSHGCDRLLDLTSLCGPDEGARSNLAANLVGFPLRVFLGFKMRVELDIQ